MSKIATRKTLEEAFSEFIINCKLKNLSVYTIQSYKNVWKRFEQFLESTDVLKANEINQQVINSYTLEMSARLKPVSVNTELRTIRAVVNYFSENEYSDKLKIPMLKEEKTIKDTYSDEELKKLLKKPNLKQCTFAEYRTWVMTNCLIGIGVRLNTLINIRVKDVDLDNASIILGKTKNKKQQIVPLPNILVKIITEYLKYRKANDEEFLFVTETGGKLSRSTVENIFRRYNNNRGVSKTSIHLFRHTFSKKWILNGGDIFRLQKILGHSSVEMVKRYVNMFSNDLKVDFDKYNPLEQLNQQKKRIPMSK